MANELERILDECIDRLNRGESLQQCLSYYPEHAAELEPLLQAMTQTKEAFPFTTSADAKRAARLRFFTALDKKKQPSFWEKLKIWQPVWSTVASIAMVLILILVALPTTSSPIIISDSEPVPSGIASTVITSPSSDGNFVFFVSDEENAIGDFSSLFITVEKVVLLKSGDSEQLIEFTPEVKEFNLTTLPGELTQELWQGNIPEGSYSKIFLYVNEVRGILKATGEEIQAKLPAGKLQLTQSFQVNGDSITSFIFDITIVKTGQSGSGKYLLKPQADGSSATQIPLLTDGQSKGKPSK